MDAESTQIFIFNYITLDQHQLFHGWFQNSSIKCHEALQYHTQPCAKHVNRPS